MTLESILAAAHIIAILTAVVFLTSETAICRVDWFNDKVVRRLVTVDRIYLVGLALVLVTGLARIFYGVKGADYYWANWLLHLKLGMFVVVALLAWRPARTYRRWLRELEASRALPHEAEINSVRKQAFLAAHLIALVPIAAAFLARGWGVIGP
jgi:putative membrane protein